MTLKFSYDEISRRYKEFVANFLLDEKEVEKVQLLPHLWTVSVPSKKFSVTIACECVGHFHGIEEWCAVVKEPNGETSNYLLFEKEIKDAILK